MRQKVEIPAGMSPNEIEEKYKVSHPTAWRASKRGWLFQNYHGDQSSKPVKKGVTQKFGRLVKHPAINISQLTSIKENKVWDILAGESSLRETSWTKFKAEWAEIRNLIREFLTSNDIDYQKERMMAICNDARIKHFIFFDNKKMLMRLKKGQNVYDDEIIESKAKAKEFLNKTQI